MKNIKLHVFISLLFLLLACGGQGEEMVEGDWIKGSPKEQIDIVERQFRGFDMAMVETGYRYQELYWAGQDENWDYANYQLKKLNKAIKNGLERRPKRAESAQYFLSTIIPSLEEVISKENLLEFNESFKTLTVNCNACHAMEKVPFFSVEIPTDRQSPIRY